MKCSKHPDIWPEHGIDSDKIDLISKCQECLNILEHRLLLEIESGNIPLVDKNFSNKVMRSITEQSELVKSSRFRRIDRNLVNKRLTFVHYVTAATATIILVMTGGFNTMFRSGLEYGDSINRLVNDISFEKVIEIPESDNLSQNFKISWEHLRDLKDNLSGKSYRQNGR